MNPRETQIKSYQKFYLKIRAMHVDVVYLQGMADKLDLKSKNRLSVINKELQTFHDEARSLERDLDESQKSDHEWKIPSGNMDYQEFRGISN